MDLKTLRFLGYTISSIATAKKYPAVEMFSYRHWSWNKEGKVEYSHTKTFLNFLSKTRKNDVVALQREYDSLTHRSENDYKKLKEKAE